MVHVGLIAPQSYIPFIHGLGLVYCSLTHTMPCFFAPVILPFWFASLSETVSIKKSIDRDLAVGLCQLFSDWYVSLVPSCNRFYPFFVSVSVSVCFLLVRTMTNSLTVRITVHVCSATPPILCYFPFFTAEDIFVSTNSLAGQLPSVAKWTKASTYLLVNINPSLFVSVCFLLFVAAVALVSNIQKTSFFLSLLLTHAIRTGSLFAQHFTSWSGPQSFSYSRTHQRGSEPIHRDVTRWIGQTQPDW